MHSYRGYSEGCVTMVAEDIRGPRKCGYILLIPRDRMASQVAYPGIRSLPRRKGDPHPGVTVW